MLGGLAGLVGLSAVAGLLITATVTPAIAVSGYAASSAISMFDNLPSVLEIDKLQQPSTLLYKDPNTGNDVELTKFFDQNRSPVTFDQVNPVMYDAILSSEDPRFYDHGGIDLIGTTRAVLTNIRGSGNVQGGSSISQQYVKNVQVQQCYSTAESDEAIQKCYSDATNSTGTEGLQRKLQEMRYAIALEQQYSKNDILLGYLNIANFGGVNYGVDAAAQYYFHTTASALTLAQAATLAGIVQNPNTYRLDQPENAANGAPNGVVEASDTVLAGLVTLRDEGTITPDQFLAAADGYGATKGRQLYVLSRMLDDGKITRDQYVAAAIEPITPTITPPTTGCAAAMRAAYFCQYVKYVVQNDPAFGATPEERQKALKQGGLKIYTTLDPRLQTAAEDTQAENAPSSVETMNFGSTTTSIEASTGRILAIAQNTQFSEDADAVANDPNLSSIVFAGNSTFGASDGFNAGSTFKLFTLIDWLEKGHSLNETLNGTVHVFKRIKNSCVGDWVNTTNTLIKNFGGDGGFVGTPMQFTAKSLNTGFFAMAEKLDLCDIQKVATKMGVTLAKGGGEVDMSTLTSVIGTNAVSPIAMAGAFATVANNGVYCQPQVVDKVTDTDGNDLPIPSRSCTQVVDPAVAATAAYALQGVMNGGTGTQGNPRDGTPLLGKTGTHEQLQTWLIESSTKVTTASWAGVVEGDGNMQKTYYNGTALSNIRYSLSRDVQAVADEVYGGDDFPRPDSNLTRQILTDLPNVVGQTVDQATATLTNAGFGVEVGDPVDSNAGAGIVAAQNPPGGKVAGGTTVTINPSNGQGVAIPNVAGQKLPEALSTLRSAGFGTVIPGTCTENANADGQGTASDTNPPGGSVVNRNAGIAVNYQAKKCPGG